MKERISIVWFKPDLRFTDHESLCLAQKSALPVRLMYRFEPTTMAYPDNNFRYGRFVYESLSDMREKLNHLDSKLHVFHNEVVAVSEIGKDYHSPILYME